MQPNTKTHKIEAKVTKTYNGINSRLSFSVFLESWFDSKFRGVESDGNECSVE